LITTAYWADRRNLKIDPGEAASFRTWFLIASAKGRYSRGSSESLLDQDLAVLRNGGGASDLLQRLEQQFGRLEFLPADLVGRSTQSGIFKAMFMLFKEDGADDWATSLRISPKHANSGDKIEFHHIFPKAYLKRERADLQDSDINDISNFAFIGSTTNKQISDKTPAVYRTSYPSARLEAQRVRFDAWGDGANDFEKFIQQRRAAIAADLNSFVGVT
jgi:hypothetical protein